MQNNAELHAVTGAFGYSGRYITQRLLEAGHPVVTLTNSPGRPNPFGQQVAVQPFNFTDPAALERSLAGVKVLYNTYWIRFDHANFRQADAITNTITMFEAAKRAGVERIVHVSIANPSIDSPFPYYRGKAQLEQALAATGVSYAILRPTVLFGREDILINNIAWSLRHLPVFGIFGTGKYKIQPVYVEDLAELAVRHGREAENIVVNATGPETFTYRGLVETIASAIGVWRPIVPVPPSAGWLATTIMGKALGDVILTRDEMRALMDGLLSVDGPSGGWTSLTEWARENAAWLGKRYASELRRRLDRKAAYK
jgi:uncharacterized protein YbjT (DUF2867 family)